MIEYAGRWLLVLLGIATAAAGDGGGAAPEPPEPLFPGLVLEDSGVMSLAGLRFNIVHHAPDWTMAQQTHDLRPDEGYPKRTRSGWELHGQFTTKSGAFAIEQLVSRVTPEELSYQVQLKSEPGVSGKALSLAIDLPVSEYAGKQIRLDTRTIELPAALRDEGEVVGWADARLVRIPTPDGTLVIQGQGKVALRVQDNRPYNEQTFQVRLHFAPDSGTIKQSLLSLSISHLRRTGPVAPTTLPRNN